MHKRDTEQQHAQILLRSSQLNKGLHARVTPEPEAYASSTLQEILHAQSLAAAPTSAPASNGTVAFVEYTDFPSAYFSNITIGSGAGAKNYLMK